MILRLQGGTLTVQVKASSFSLAKVTLTSLENPTNVVVETSNNTNIYNQTTKTFTFNNTNIRGYHVLVEVDGNIETESIVLDVNYLNKIICQLDEEAVLLIMSLIILRDSFSEACDCDLIQAASDTLNLIINKTGTCNDC